MKSRSIFLSAATLFVLLFTACETEAQTTKQPAPSASATAIEVIQFHSEHRCYTCNKIEEYTKATLKQYADISFSLVNVDDKKNEKKATQFEAAGTALYLYNPKTGKKKDLTDFAFMNAGNEDKFVAGLKKHIADFGG